MFGNETTHDNSMKVMLFPLLTFYSGTLFISVFGTLYFSVYTEAYIEHFGDLKSRLRDKTVKRVYGLTDKNYDTTYINDSNFLTNIQNQEIDIVLETDHHFFIGEAKYEVNNFNYNSQCFLSHQLLRQYITTKILLHDKKINKEIIQFVVCDGSIVENMKNNYQVRFLKKYYDFDTERIVSWDAIAKL